MKYFGVLLPSGTVCIVNAKRWNTTQAGILIFWKVDGEFETAFGNRQWVQVYELSREQVMRLSENDS